MFPVQRVASRRQDSGEIADQFDEEHSLIPATRTSSTGLVDFGCIIRSSDPGGS